MLSFALLFAFAPSSFYPLAVIGACGTLALGATRSAKSLEFEDAVAALLFRLSSCLYSILLLLPSFLYEVFLPKILARSVKVIELV
jgi:hypothetical protein